MCMACHGGTYTSANDVMGSRFLPFDVFSFRYPDAAGWSFDEQQERLRKLNAIVASTDPGPPILDLIGGMYPGGVTNEGSTAVDGYVPAGWSGDPTLYTGVVRPYCRTCHLAQPATFMSLSDFQGLAEQIKTLVCDKHDMPHAQVPYGVDRTRIGFWNDRVAQQDLGNFLKSQGVASCLPSD